MNDTIDKITLIVYNIHCWVTVMESPVTTGELL